MDITVFCKTVMWSKNFVPRYANQHIIIIQKVSVLVWYHNLADLCYDSTRRRQCGSVLRTSFHFSENDRCQQLLQNVIHYWLKSFFNGSAALHRLWPPCHTWCATVGRAPLEKWSAHRRDLYLTTHNSQTSMPPVEFEPTIAVGEQP
jgi:hypothetical protein